MSGIKEEKQQFSLHKNMIFHLIDSQAGSLSKAVAEAVMNSIDAHATSIDITLDETSLVIKDNGKGFESREEILKCFSVFGFEHDDRQRELGRFGLGRAQAWAYASTLWRTNTFELDVDIKVRGIEYDLREGCPNVPGLTIEAKLYEPINARDIGVVERELQEQVLYSRVKVTFNGRTITRNLDKEKWNHSIDEAYIRLNDTGNLKLYNLGIFVCEFSSYKFGVGGVVVTKTGNAFMLNMARNAVIESKCPLWRKIKPKLDEISGREREVKKTLSQDQKRHLRKRWYSEGGGIEEFADLYTKNLFQCVDKRWHSINDLLMNYEKISFAADTIGLAKRINETPNCIVLNKTMLDEVNAPSVGEFLKRLVTTNAGDFVKFVGSYERLQDYKKAFEKITFFDDFMKINPGASIGRRQAKDSEVTPLHKAVLKGLRSCECYIRQAVKDAIGSSVKRRNLLAGISEDTLGWTDGASNIWLNVTMLDKATTGISGALPLLSLMLHEYLHNEADEDGHGHPPEFFERFEYAMIERGNLMGLAADSFLRAFAAELKASQKRLKSADVVKSLSYTQDATARLTVYLEEVAKMQTRDGLTPEAIATAEPVQEAPATDPITDANRKAVEVIEAVMHPVAPPAAEKPAVALPDPLQMASPRKPAQLSDFPLLGIEPTVT